MDGNLVHNGGGGGEVSEADPGFHPRGGGWGDPLVEGAWLELLSTPAVGLGPKPLDWGITKKKLYKSADEESTLLCVHG